MSGNGDGVRQWRIADGQEVGKLLATACEHDKVRVFDSYNFGDLIITIDTLVPSFYPITPLAWSNDGKHIFATSVDNRVKSFDASTGSQLVESPVLDGTVESIALAGHGKFIATFAARSISFLDTSTLSQIGPVIEDSEDVRSIALSPHSSHLATGQYKGKVVVRDLGNVLPDSYGPFHVCRTSLTLHPALTHHVDAPRQAPVREDEQPSTSGGHKPPDPNSVGFRHSFFKRVALTTLLCIPKLGRTCDRLPDSQRRR